MYPSNYRYLLIMTSQAPKIQCSNWINLHISKPISPPVCFHRLHKWHYNQPNFSSHKPKCHDSFYICPLQSISFLKLILEDLHISHFHYHHSSLSTGITSSLDCFCSLLLLYLWQIFLWISASC